MPGMSAGRPWLRARSGHVAETTSAHSAHSAHHHNICHTLHVDIIGVARAKCPVEITEWGEQEKCACSSESVQLWLHKRNREVAVDGGKSAEQQLNAATQLNFGGRYTGAKRGSFGEGRAGARRRWTGMPWEMSVRWASADFVTVSSWVGLSGQRSGFWFFFFVVVVVGTAGRQTGDKIVTAASFLSSFPRVLTAVTPSLSKCTTGIRRNVNAKHLMMVVASS